MEEVPLYEALLAGYSVARRHGFWFSPSYPSMINDLTRGERSAGTLILPSGKTNHQLVNIDVHRVRSPKIESESTAEELWKCVKEHYGITAVTAFLSPGAIPIPKSWLGHRTHPGSSGVTNLISEFGLRFYPLKRLKQGTQLARSAKAVFGSIRVFGVLGRANAIGFIGFAIFDVISLANCMDKK